MNPFDLLKNLNYFQIYFLHVLVFNMHAYQCITGVWWPQSLEMVLDLPELKLKLTLGHYVSAANQIWVFCEYGFLSLQTCTSQPGEEHSFQLR